jgi:enoyl-CoA hydratase/carnithine racemase
MASDLRHGTAQAQVAFLFVRVGLAGSDMGACAMLPRIIGLGRAAELLLTGRTMTGDEALAWGFFNALHDPGSLRADASAVAHTIAAGPSLAHAMTKRMLHAEWSLDLDAAIDAEARAQAALMNSNDFRRAYEAFTAKQTPVFEGD